MKIQFEDNLDFQREAIDAVCDLFAGQERGASSFGVSAPLQRNSEAFSSSATELGSGNELRISPEDLFTNLQRVQLRNRLTPSESLESNDFTVEMETGTGKTYVYLRTILELNQRFGFSKFVIVVPSIAIKEGVQKSLQMTRGHFRTLYDGLPYHYFPYDSGKMSDIYNFALSGEVQIMITTVGAINKRDVNNLYREDESGTRPLDLIRATRPILIVDEPQSVDGGLRGAGKAALDGMGALATLRYSAIHVNKHHMVYRLNAVDAYAKRLVKQVEVAAASIDPSFDAPYVKFIQIRRTKSKVTAEVELDIQTTGGHVRRQRKWVEDGTDLEALTGRAVYASHQIGEIGVADGLSFLELRSAGREVYLSPDSTSGDLDPLIVQRQMIRRTIKEHLDKEIRLAPLGIKVLSLFFIDKVERYRYYDENGLPVRGPYAEMFEEEYRRLRQHPAYQTLLHAVDATHAVSDVHDGYFSIDRAGGWTDTAANGQGADAERGYNLIMKEKERLLRFETPLKFIFSHSALREGWDNPNIFQICTLRDVQSETARRQTIGRGLRLCVNQEGTRVRDDDVNILTVIANESYEAFAEALQTEIELDTGVRFGIVDRTSFASLVVDSSGVHPEYFGVNRSELLWQAFRSSGYLSADGAVTEELRQALASRTVVLPEDAESVRDGILEILTRTVTRVVVRNADEAKPISVREDVYLSSEFQALWSRVNARTAYRLNFDNEGLITRCIESLKLAPALGQTRLRWDKATIDVTLAGVEATSQKRHASVVLEETGHGLPDILTELQDRTQLTRKTLARILIESQRLSDFKRSPERFIALAAEVINRAKQIAVVGGIQYERIAEKDEFAQTLLKKHELRGYIENLVIDAKRSVYEDVLVDSSVERAFALQLEADDSVDAFVKLPRWFKIPTPLGSYNPDWALVAKNETGETLFFVVETKGTVFLQDLRESEAAKIHCGHAHFRALDTPDGSVGYRLAKTLDDVRSSTHDPAA